jgi:hypothetical protein
MGIVHAHRGRLAPAILATGLVVLAIAAVMAVTAGPAAAFQSYLHGTATSCGSCHPNGDVLVKPTNAACAVCHTGYTIAHAKNGVASTCWTCHTPGQDVSGYKTAAGCGSSAAGAGCHASPGHTGSTPTTCVTCHGVTVNTTDPGQSAHHKTSVTDVQVKALLTIKVPASVKVKKTIKASGLAKSDQAGYKVTVLVQKKSGKKWVKATSKAAVWNQAASSWTFSYKPATKGSWRMQASTPVVAGTNGNPTAITAAKTAFKTFKVK